MKPALNDNLVHVFLCDGNGLQLQVRYVIGAVIGSVLHLLDFLPQSQENRAFGCQAGLLFHGFKSRHFLGFLHDALTGCQVAVLTGHAHLSGQPFFGQGPKGLAGQIIVSADDSLYIAVQL